MKNKNSIPVVGIGYFGEGSHKSRIDGKMSKKYNTWNGMLERCYDDRTWTKHPFYKDCSVVEQWHNFQVFGDWFEENYNPEYMEGWQLDKDILIKGNKIYSPETCCFVPSEINNIIFKKRENSKNIYLVGVNKHGNKFRARLSTGNYQKHIGLFDTELEAYNAYKLAKEAYIKELAEKYKHQITEACYQALINYK